MIWIAGQQLPCFVCAAASNMTPDDKYSNQIIIPCPLPILIFLQTFNKCLSRERDVLVHQVSKSRSSVKGKIKVFWAMARDWALSHILKPWDHDKAFSILKSILYCFSFLHLCNLLTKVQKILTSQSRKDTAVIKQCSKHTCIIVKPIAKKAP